MLTREELEQYGTFREMRGGKLVFIPSYNATKQHIEDAAKIVAGVVPKAPRQVYVDFSSDDEEEEDEEELTDGKVVDPDGALVALVVDGQVRELVMNSKGKPDADNKSGKVIGKVVGREAIADDGKVLGEVIGEDYEMVDEDEDVEADGGPSARTPDDDYEESEDESDDEEDEEDGPVVEVDETEEEDIPTPVESDADGSDYGASEDEESDDEEEAEESDGEDDDEKEDKVVPPVRRKLL